MKKLACITLRGSPVIACIWSGYRGDRVPGRHPQTRRYDDPFFPAQMSGGAQNGQKDTNSQLDKLERQTANTVIQPAAKTPKVQPYKLPAEAKPAADNFYQQSMPSRTGVKNTPGSGSPNRSSRSNRVNLHGR